MGDVVRLGRERPGLSVASDARDSLGGRKADFRDLYLATFPRLVRTVWFVVRDHEQAQEITQDAFIDLHRQWSKIRSYDRPDLWVRRVALRKAQREAGRSVRRAQAEQSQALLEAVNDPALPDPELRGALLALPPMQRAVVVLFYLEDRPMEDVAWSKPPSTAASTYPWWGSVDQVRQRFLVHASQALEVYRPGRTEPLLAFECTDDGATGCLGAAPGPGPRDVTMVSADLHLVVADTDGMIKDDLGEVGGGLTRLAWAPDGGTLAVAGSESRGGTGSVLITLRDVATGQLSILFSYDEQAPSWDDPEEHRYGDGPGQFNDWGTPSVSDLQWSPDSSRVAFTLTTSPGGDDSDRHVRSHLFVADPVTGTVDEVADLGECSEPVPSTGRPAGECDLRPALSWTTELVGPMVWLCLE
ncbi:MAG TPA: hypothetical protein VFK41_12070 [Nocardioidaceae bacterium]|nr:hypothetical protein [Nocardioidaceae bacterium]